MANIADSTLYTPLDPDKHQVRLMHLQPGISNELIECILEKINLESKPKYEALSYEWGDERMFQPEIKLCGNIVRIRNNLWWALHHLRHESESRILWIDALCVNQQNIFERNHQVAQMKRIYSQASKVVVWIGREEHPEGEYLYHETLSAINFLEVLYSDSLENYPFLMRPDQTKPSSLVRTPHTSKWDAILKLCRRSYWKRLWIIQEVMLASSLVIHCGNKVIPWDHFARFCIRVSNLTSSLDITLADIMANTNACRIAKYQVDYAGHSSSFKFDKASLPLVALLDNFRDALCQDKRDKIYGLLSLCQTCCRDSIPVDYSMDLVAVCAKLLEHHITHHYTDGGEEAMIVADKILDSVGVHRAYNQIHRNEMSLRYVKSSLLLPVSTRDFGNVVFIGLTEVSPQNSVRIRTEKEAFNWHELNIRYMIFFRAWYRYFNPESDFRFLPTSNQRNALVRTYIYNLTNHKNNQNPEKESITEFLERVSQEWGPLLKELGVVTFLTSIGIAGCATEGIEIGDKVCGFNGHDTKSWGRVGFLSKNIEVTKWIRKGLVLPLERYHENFDPPVIVPPQHKIKVEIDVATLIYISGYF